MRVSRAGFIGALGEYSSSTEVRGWLADSEPRRLRVLVTLLALKPWSSFILKEET